MKETSLSKVTFALWILVLAAFVFSSIVDLLHYRVMRESNNLLTEQNHLLRINSQCIGRELMETNIELKNLIDNQHPHYEGKRP